MVIVILYEHIGRFPLFLMLFEIKIFMLILQVKIKANQQLTL